MRKETKQVLETELDETAVYEGSLPNDFPIIRQRTKRKTKDMKIPLVFLVFYRLAARLMLNTKHRGICLLWSWAFQVKGMIIPHRCIYFFLLCFCFIFLCIWQICLCELKITEILESCSQGSLHSGAMHMRETVCKTVVHNCLKVIASA